MSVLVSKRKESKLEVIVYSIELHNMLVELMQILISWFALGMHMEKMTVKTSISIII